MPNGEKKISAKQAIKSLRGKKHPAPDVVMIIRGTLDQEGEWHIDWEAMNWLRGEAVGSSGLPYGFPMSASKTLLGIGAEDSAEKSIGGLGTTLGKEFIKTIASGGIEIGSIFKDR